ncbi:MAG TPA: SRPBCC family protein [Phenylobacterium sp.]|jgi:carbon monoxide dehydrogenase subunit G|uniref:SRPBCC family protein n=1 Tax=Phenylobacterium sp. TaxID=1871053 RepID=UPI002D727C1E|nr:SRPBCC family protein [Phenylobacterium sp.]HZZ67984.1 SRPBCC family protein [Phenylobacterium sp.]
MANDTFRVARSIHVDAPAAEIFPHIDDFRAWAAWSPFEKMDADMQKTYSGAARGVGAQYAWVGKKAGAGSMEVLTAEAPSRVVIDLKFTRPMKANNVAEFTIEPDGAGSKVTWAMTGPLTLVSKIMHAVFPMEKMVGPMFEDGLKALKDLSEKALVV